MVWRLLGAWAAVNHDGNVWRRRRVKPERHGAHWRSSEIRRQLEGRGVEFETVGTFVTELRNGERTITLASDDFETQALANALDRLAGRWVVDRGACDLPRVSLW